MINGQKWYHLRVFKLQSNFNYICHCVEIRMKIKKRRPGLANIWIKTWLSLVSPVNLANIYTHFKSRLAAAAIIKVRLITPNRVHLINYVEHLHKQLWVSHFAVMLWWILIQAIVRKRQNLTRRWDLWCRINSCGLRQTKSCFCKIKKIFLLYVPT